MPDWTDIINKVKDSGSSADIIRKQYVKRLSAHTKRCTIIYYSGWLQKKPNLEMSITDNDKNGFMNAIHNLDSSKGLDLILHTPGGDVAATESLINYLHSKFSDNIRAIIPQIAMSGGTMLACACKEIVMGKQSNLGPIDPLLGGRAAEAFIEEYEKVKDEVTKNPSSITFYQHILAKYPPAFIGECYKAQTWANTILENALEFSMFKNDPNRKSIIDAIVKVLGSHKETLSHGKHLHINDLTSLGLKINPLEIDQKLQDLVLSVHHATMISFNGTNAIKIIENNLGKSYVLQAN